jgi:signal transduction histidine kinase
VLLEVLAEEKQQALETTGDHSITVMADPTILGQALVNLIHNAVKFSPEKGAVKVRIVDSGKDAIVEIQDNGSGIAPEHRTHIFERFYRMDKARAREAGGAGLGLSIAEWAVKIHTGAIELECPAGGGSIFRIHLPKNS